MKQHRNLLCTMLVGLVFAALTLGAWLRPAADFSDSERRKLTQRPALTLAALRDGSYMTDFEKYTQDQFPLRDDFRTLKAINAYYLLRQLDNNDIYLSDGYAAKLEYPLNPDSIDHAAGRFQYIYETWLRGHAENIYLSIIPDKSYYLAQDGPWLTLDYTALFDSLRAQMPYASYIDITGTLERSDYYKTDTHWRQECLADTAAALAEAMGVTLQAQYQPVTLDRPFYGVYYGQSALPLQGEALTYLTSTLLEQCIVTNYEDNSVGGIYNLEKAAGKDPYELFLSGSVSLLTIENPQAAQERELIVFRDSFGSSLAPLLAEGYSKITLVDIRYLRTDFLGSFIDFDGADVLFLYSTLVLNHSETFT